MIKTISILWFFIGLFFFKSEAQENTYSIWGSYIVAPSEMSYQAIYRSDSFYEKYIDGTAQGYGFGFSVPLFKIFSPIVAIDFVRRNGIDTHGTENERVSINGSRFKFGGAFHLKRGSSPYLDFNVGFIRNKFNVTSQYSINKEYKQEGFGRGVYIGPSVLFGLTAHTAIKFEMNASLNGTDFNSIGNYTGSGEITQFIALNSDFSISYVYRF